MMDEMILGDGRTNKSKSVVVKTLKNKDYNKKEKTVSKLERIGEQHEDEDDSIID